MPPEKCARPKPGAEVPRRGGGRKGAGYAFRHRYKAHAPRAPLVRSWEGGSAGVPHKSWRLSPAGPPAVVRQREECSSRHASGCSSFRAVRVQRRRTAVRRRWCALSETRARLSDFPLQGRACNHFPTRLRSRVAVPSVRRWLLPLLARPAFAKTHACGAGGRARTGDNVLGRQMLYRLSYTRIDCLSSPPRLSSRLLPRSARGKRMQAFSDGLPASPVLRMLAVLGESLDNRRGRGR